LRGLAYSDVVINGLVVINGARSEFAAGRCR